MGRAGGEFHPNNVILDVDVGVDYLSNRLPHGKTATQALEKASRQGCRIWLVAACVPTLLELLTEAFSSPSRREEWEGDPTSASSRARDALRSLLKTADVLSSNGFHVEAALASPRPMDALILQAADSLSDDVSILSRDPDFLPADPRVISPEDFLDRAVSVEKSERAMPFVDLSRQQHRILGELEKGLSSVLRHGQYIMGPEITVLERKLAEYAGVDHAVCCASGTDALLLALMAYGIGPGDVVFSSPFTFISTAEVIALLGATPVFVDIDPRTFNIDPDCLEQAIRACKEDRADIYPLPAGTRAPSTRLKPKGILPVDLFGLPAEYHRINAIADEHGLFVIEDAAQSFGAEYHGKRACSLADIACTSFYPSKPLGGYGDGGAVFTDHAEMAERIASIRIHGMGASQYDNIRIGINGRMDTLQAALLLPKLEIFSIELESRQRVAGRYTELLSSHTSLQIPHVPAGLRSAWALYSVVSEARDAIRSALAARKIPTAVYYPKPLHLQTAFAHLGYRNGDFPVSESTARHIFSLPMHPYLQEEEIQRVVACLHQALASPGAK